jgi:MFS family permease
MTSQIPVEGDAALKAVPTPHQVAEAVSDSIPATGRWLWIIYPLAMLVSSVVWGGVMQVLLGKQIAQAVPGAAASAGVLGLTISVAAVTAVIATPIVGRLSDRTRTKFLGRRNIWVLGAGIVSAVGLVVMSQLTEIVIIAIVWAIVVIPLNAVGAALVAVMPERVPVRSRGTMSGLTGAAQLVGAYVGVAVAGLSQEIFMGYLLIAAIFLLVTVIFAFTTKDSPAPDLSALSHAERKERTRLPGFRTAPDYWWTFAGRFLLIFGYFSVISFQLYILRDYIKVGDVNTAATTLVGISGLSTVLSLVFAALGGWVSDRAGRLRIFVAVSTLMFVPAGLIYLFWPTLTGAWIASGVLGAAFGIYIAVDQALITRVLPNVDNAGRDLGIMNIANSGPQIIAPVVGGALIAATGNYQLLFIVMIVCVILGAISVRFIRGVR